MSRNFGRKKPFLVCLDFQEGALCFYEFLDVKSVNVKKFEY